MLALFFVDRVGIFDFGWAAFYPVPAVHCFSAFLFSLRALGATIHPCIFLACPHNFSFLSNSGRTHEVLTPSAYAPLHRCYIQLSRTMKLSLAHSLGEMLWETLRRRLIRSCRPRRGVGHTRQGGNRWLRRLTDDNSFSQSNFFPSTSTMSVSLQPSSTLGFPSMYSHLFSYAPSPSHPIPTPPVFRAAYSDCETHSYDLK